MYLTVRFALLSLIVLTAPTIIRLCYDWWKIKIKKSPITKAGYVKRNLWTGIGILLAAGLDSLIHPFVVYPWAVLFSYTIFFLLFDYGLNLARGKKLFYVSPNPNHPSRWERTRQFLSHMPIVGELFVKLWVLSVGIGFYYFYEMIY